MSWNLSENLRNSALRFPNNIACVCLNESITYVELDELVNRFASSLSAQNIGKGDKIALLLGNSIDFVIAYYGVLRTGATVVPINPIFTEREVSYILTDSQAKGIIAASSLKSMVEILQNQFENIQFTIFTGESENSFDGYIRHPAAAYETPYIDEEDIAVILYTSGTTGTPKGAMLTHRNMGSNAEASCKIFEMDQEDRIVTVLPIFHVFCMTICMNAPIASGASMLILPKFSPTEVTRVIREEQATIFPGVPTMFNFLFQLPESTAKDLSSLRFCVSGGAPIPKELLHKFEDKFQVLVLEGYGLSESSPVASFNPLKGIRKAGSIGLAIPGVTMKVVDLFGNTVPTGEVGELVIQGPNVMKGYLGMPEKTAETIKEGWLYTGDMATVDEDGYFYIVDRKKDMILVGGYNVYPREVEEVLYQHPSVVEAAVIGFPDSEYGELVKAFIVTRSEELSEEDIVQFCRNRLAKYKVPKQVAFLSELPKNSTGKIVRRELRDSGNLSSVSN